MLLFASIVKVFIANTIHGSVLTKSQVNCAIRHQNSSDGGCARERDLHQHHQIVQLESGPSPQPTDFPIAEPRAEHHRSAKPKELRFHLHVPMTHSFGAERQLRLGLNLRRWEALHVSSPGDPACRYCSFDCQVGSVQAIIPDLNGGVNQPRIGSNSWSQIHPLRVLAAFWLTAGPPSPLEMASSGESAPLKMRGLRVARAWNCAPAAAGVNFLTLSWEGCNFG